MVKWLNKNQGVNFDQKLNEIEEQKAYDKWKIGPFSFDIDDEIDTEILTNDEVYKDL